MGVGREGEGRWEKGGGEEGRREGRGGGEERGGGEGEEETGREVGAWSAAGREGKGQGK